MRTTKLISKVLVAFALVAAPASASAQTAALPALQGAVIDPAAMYNGSTLRIVPPAGGHMMLYRDGQPVAWWLQPTFATLTPGKVYGLVAVRGTQMLFNASIVARPGMTEVVFTKGNDSPAVGYTPPLVISPETGLPMVELPRGLMTTAAFDELLAELELRTTDSSRFAMVKRYARRYLFRDAQIDQVLEAFEEPRYRTAVEKLLDAGRI